MSNGIHQLTIDKALGKRQDRLETHMDRMEAKLDKVLEFVAIQHGERVFAVRFWKHAVWIAPTVIALAALIKSFFSNWQT